MDQSLVASRFVAFVCFLNSGKDGKRSPQQAGQLARENWKQFLPYASEELVQLLTPKTAPRLSARKDTCRRSTKEPQRKLAAAG